MEYRDAPWRQWYERLAEKRRLVRYDMRGSGLSERSVTDYSLDAMVLDLEAVVDRLGLAKFVLFGMAYAGPVAIAYAARHPERVSHLILWCSWSRTSDTASPQLRALRRLIESDWDLYTRTATHTFTGWTTGERALSHAAIMRESITPDAMLETLRAHRKFDVSSLLPQVRSPTLVLHRRQTAWLDVDVARDLASGITDAHMALLEGESVTPWIGDIEAVLEAIDEFLREGEEAKTEDEGLSADIVHTILFTDVEGSTALTDRLGDAKARELLREHERMVREALKAHGGSEVKTMGDGFMTSFSSATRALECAVAMQRAFAEHNEKANEPIKVRIGLNAGEPIAEEDPGGRGDLFGTSVNLAARIAAKAGGGEILASNVVRELVAGKPVLFSDRGDATVRGFEDSVRLYEVSWREEE
jgi:class 3 adenylate cyclase